MQLWKNNRGHNRYVHRLVAEAFLPNWDPSLSVDHLNRDRTDNRAENLRVVTMKEQVENQDRTNCGRGLRFPVEQRAPDGSLVASHGSAAEARAATGIGEGPIRACVAGRRAAAGGFLWTRPARPDLPGEAWMPLGPHAFVSSMGRYRFRDNVPKTPAELSARNKYPIVKVAGKALYLHRLVAAAFLDPPTHPARTIVNHKDGNKLNAAASNLEWCTHSENSLHARATGLR